MATYYGSWAGGDDYRAKVDVTTSSAPASVVIKVVTSIDVLYGYDGGSNTSGRAQIGSQAATIDGQNFDSSKVLCSKQVTITRTTSRQSISVLGRVYSYAGGSEWSGSISIDPLASYSVKYSANGGTGAPSAQTKWYGTNLTLSSTTPTRTGYAFVKWNTKADGSGTSYAAGASYTANAGVTLYAQWKANTYKITPNANGGTLHTNCKVLTKTYGTALALWPSNQNPSRTGYTFQSWNTKSNGSGTAYAAGAQYKTEAAATLYAIWKANTYAVTFNANGGSGAPSAQTKTHGVALTLSSTRPTRTGYTFLGWNTVANGSGTSYAAGGTYTANAAVTLYAQWRADAPTLVVPEAYRSDALGAADDEGAYATVTARWTQADATLGGSVTVTVTVRSRGADPSQGDPTASVTQTGTSGSASVTVGAGTLTQDDAYTITVTATNALGTTTVVADVGTAWYPIDVKAGGHGVAIGGVAHDDGLAVNMDERVSGRLDVSGRLSLGDGSTTTEAAIYAKLASRNASAIRLIDYDANGSAVLIGDGGLTVVGGGEAANALYTALINAGDAVAGTKQLHLASDSALYLYSNCNSIGSRHSATLGTDGALTNSGIVQAKSSNVTSNTTPSSAATGNGYFRFLDSAGASIGYLAPYFTTAAQYVRLQAQRTISGSNKYCQLNLGVDSSGNALVSIAGTGARAAWIDALTDSAEATWKDALNVGMSAAIWSGVNVAAGGTIGTSTNVFKYRLFWVQLGSSNNNWCLCYRVGSTSSAGYIRGVGAYTTTSNSYVFEVNISVSTAGLCKVVNAAQHVLNSNVSGTALNVSAVYGIR